MSISGRLIYRKDLEKKYFLTFFLLNRLHVKKKVSASINTHLKLVHKLCMSSSGMQCRSLKYINLMGCYTKEIHRKNKEMPARAKQALMSIRAVPTVLCLFNQHPE